MWVNQNCLLLVLVFALDLIPSAPALAGGSKKQPTKVARKNGKLKRPIYVKGRFDKDGHYVKGHDVRE